MRTIYHFTYLLLCFVLVACALSTPRSTEVITPDNAHQVTQLNRRPGFLERNRGSITNVAFSPHGDVLAAGYSEGPVVRLYDVMTLKLLTELKTQFDDIVAFSPDGKLVAAGGGGYTPEVCACGVQIWDVATHEQRLKLDDFRNPVTSITFSPDSALLATGDGSGMGFEGSAKIWNVGTGELLAEFSLENHPNYPPGNLGVFGVAFNPDGTLLATANGNGKVLIWDVVNKQQKTALNEDGVFGVTFSPDGTILATSEYLDETDRAAVIRLWDVATGELLLMLKGHTDSVTSITFNPDGRILASASSDGTVRLWDVKTGKALAVLDGVNDSNVAFSLDDTLLATGGDILRLWGVPTH
jgi:WD40 repeat protein